MNDLSNDRMLDEFERHRPYLFGIAYRMLGSAMEADDILQDAFLRFQKVDLTTLESSRAYLSTIVSRLCLDFLKSARVQREQYMGPWLPEPILTGSSNPASTQAERYDMISMAFMVIFESLSPLERAVFILRELFDYEYAEIAHIVDRRPDYCRQLYRRAKQHLVQRKPRFESTHDQQQEMLGRFMTAAMHGNLDGLTSLLATDAVHWSDGGGKVSAATRPIHGAQAVAKFFLGIIRLAPESARPQLAEINGETALLIFVDDELYSVMTIVTDGELIYETRVVNNPDKLQHLRQVMQAS